jgi:hypothetical protein
MGMTINKSTALFSEAWCAVPFTVIPKTPLDEVIEVLLELPPCNALRKEC